MIKVIGIIMFILIFVVPLGLNLLVLFDDLKRRRRRREELSNLLPILKSAKVREGKLEGVYADLPVEIFFKDYLTNHTFDHSLFHIRIKASLPFDFHYGSKENGESGGERTIAENSLEVQRDAGSWLKALDQILQIYHEVGTEEKERFLQVVGNIRANSQEEFFLRPENVTCALGAMEMVYRVGCPRAGGVEDGKTDDDKTDQSGSGCPDTSEHYLSGADSGGRGSRGRGSRSRREQRG